jgi:hypothetical protein
MRVDGYKEKINEDDTKSESATTYVTEKGKAVNNLGGP